MARFCFAAWIALGLLSSPALAAGFYFPDLGAKPLGRGATGAAGPGDLSALAINPAGLAELTGLRLQAELSVVNQPVSFQRAGSCGSGSALCPAVENDGGPFLDTVSGASLQLGDFVLALGAYGPPSVGRYRYPDPRVQSANVGLGAPQRYSLVESDNFILYPGIGAAWRAQSWLDLGAVVQLRTVHLHQTQSIFVLGDIGGDIPEADAIASFDARDSARLAFGFGLVARPAKGLSIGLSARPAIPVHAEGTLDVAAPLATAVGITVSGRAAKVDLTLPAEARLGIRYAEARWLAFADLTWEGWGVLRELVVTPLDVVLKTGSGANEVDTKVGPIRLQKHYRGAFSFRLGGEYALFDWLRLRAGALYETSAIPDETLQVDFPNSGRAAGTLGATAQWRGFEATVGYAHFFQTNRAVSTSIATRTNPYPAPPFVIGNGQYQTSLDALASQLAYAF